MRQPIIKLIRLFFFLGCFWPSYAFATGEICGDGVDNDGAGGAALCGISYVNNHDKDRDAFWDIGGGPNAGIDGNDTDRTQFPGQHTSTGCAALEFKTMQADGNYSACEPLSGLDHNDCGHGAQRTFWLSPTGTTGGAGGTFAAPWDPRCLSNTALACYHVPASGDCFVARGGTFSGSYVSGVTRQLYFTTSGTATNHIVLMSAPGERFVVAGAGVYVTDASQEVFPIDITSNYWVMRDITVQGGWSNSGIRNDQGDANEYYNLLIQDIAGNCNNNNCAAIKFNADSNDNYLHHITYKDNYDRRPSATAPQAAACGVAIGVPCYRNDNNTVGPVFFKGTGNRVTDSVIYSTVSLGVAYGMKIKHGKNDPTTTIEIARNVFANFFRVGIVTGQCGTWIHHNFFKDIVLGNSGSTIDILDHGGMTCNGLNVVEDNTIQDSPFLQINPSSAYVAIPTPVVTVRRNVVTDNRPTTYSSLGTDGFIRVHHYGTTAQYNDVIGGGKLAPGHFTNNCYFNTKTPTPIPLFFDIFADNSAANLGGTSYTGMAAWQAAGYDAGSFLEDPGFNAEHIATSTNCDTWGWADDLSGGVTTTTTSVSTTTTTSVSTTTTSTPTTASTTVSTTSTSATTLPGGEPEGAGERGIQWGIRG